MKWKMSESSLAALVFHLLRAGSHCLFLVEWRIEPLLILTPSGVTTTTFQNVCCKNAQLKRSNGKNTQTFYLTKLSSNKAVLFKMLLMYRIIIIMHFKY